MPQLNLYINISAASDKHVYIDWGVSHKNVYAIRFHRKKTCEIAALWLGAHTNDIRVVICAYMYARVFVFINIAIHQYYLCQRRSWSSLERGVSKHFVFHNPFRHWVSFSARSYRTCVSFRIFLSRWAHHRKFFSLDTRFVAFLEYCLAVIFRKIDVQRANIEERLRALSKRFKTKDERDRVVRGKTLST